MIFCSLITKSVKSSSRRKPGRKKEKMKIVRIIVGESKTPAGLVESLMASNNFSGTSDFHGDLQIWLNMELDFGIARQLGGVAIVILSVEELGGNPDGECYARILSLAKKKGLKLCTLEQALQLRKQYVDQPNEESVLVMTELLPDGVEDDPWSLLGLIRVESSNAFLIIGVETVKFFEEDDPIWPGHLVAFVRK